MNWLSEGRKKGGFNGRRKRFPSFLGSRGKKMDKERRAGGGELPSAFGGDLKVRKRQASGIRHVARKEER